MCRVGSIYCASTRLTITPAKHVLLPQTMRNLCTRPLVPKLFCVCIRVLTRMPRYVISSIRSILAFSFPEKGEAVLYACLSPMLMSERYSMTSDRYSLLFCYSVQVPLDIEYLDPNRYGVSTTPFMLGRKYSKKTVL